MVEISFNTGENKRYKRGLNFITTKIDPIEVSLGVVINIGLLVITVVTLMAWILCGWEYYLQRRLDRTNRELNDLAAQVETKMEERVGVTDDYPGIRFESKFLATKQKLTRYGQLADDEKMVSFFQILGALTPPGVQILTLRVEPHSAEITSFVADKKAYSDLAANIWSVNNATFPDGKKLIIDEVSFPDVAMSHNNSNGAEGLNVTWGFSYTIEDADNGGNDES